MKRSKSRYVPKVASKVRMKPADDFPVPRPLLTELIMMLQGITERPMPIEEWNEVFYNMAQQPNVPKCLKELVWHQRNGYLESDDLTDLLRFNAAMRRCPANVG